MKNIHSLILDFITMVVIITINTSYSAELAINFVDGAEYAGVVTGKANFVGAAGIDNITLSGSVTDSIKLTTGNVKVASSAAFGANVIMNGGTLESTAAVNIPALVMTAAGTVTAGGNGALAGLSGDQKLTIAGTGIVTPADLSGAAAPVDISGIVNFGASAASKLPAADVNVLSGGLAKVMAATADCAPDDMIVQSGGVLEVAASVNVPADTGADLFGTLKFNTGSTLKLGNATVWARPITVGTAL